MRKVYDATQSVPPVFLDGAVVVVLAMFTAAQMMFSGEEAYKYVDPHVLFWAKASLGILAAGLGALKAFRSTSYSTHLANKLKQTGNTEIITKS